ncbi:Potassium-transporting ATPase A subunit [Streptomyces sp. yr375]|nr:Potassium-transporting ATPase A subunit [Streptomyces sp. yr375]
MGPVNGGRISPEKRFARTVRTISNLFFWFYSSDRHWRVEKWIYKGIGADPNTEMRWPAYLRGVLAFSAVSVLFLYLLQRLQGHLPGSLGFSAIDPDQAFNTAVSLVTNTNWQSYYGEQAVGHVVQTAGFAVQNFVSAAVGIAVAVVRGFARCPRRTPRSCPPSSSNALIIIALVPLALRGVRYRPMSADRMLRRNLGIYGIGGLIAPFIGIKLIDLLISLIPGL